MNIGAAWVKTKEKEDGSKLTWLSVQINLPIIGKLNFALFKNEKKEKDIHPDYNVVWSDRESSNSDEPGFQE